MITSTVTVKAPRAYVESRKRERRLRARAAQRTAIVNVLRYIVYSILCNFERIANPAKTNVEKRLNWFERTTIRVLSFSICCMMGGGIILFAYGFFIVACRFILHAIFPGSY